MCIRDRYNVIPLVDYCDMPHIFIQLPTEPLTDTQRDDIVQRALHFHKDHPPFNVFRRNCEHSTNNIIRGKSRSWQSPQVSYVFWNGFRMLASLIGIVFLYNMGMLCFDKFCAQWPLGALLGYHLFTSVPVLLQCTVHLVRSVYNLNSYRANGSSVLSRDDYLHLLAKEVGRFVSVGAGTLAVIALMPTMIFDTGHVLGACFICTIAFLSWNLLFSIAAQSVTRWLIDKFGKAWLL
eukprot:TRINITY_DN3485_c0_g1_i2.p1 TRINITY_DN3485_c0_g1~~TRINITY_DN3485_c0_g1_i2.p1  ORF type:complete len:236 (+),score=48.25 TRINITY_DN3485_c0_g1_i2:105-812(+)